MAYGLLELPWWGVALATLGMCHVTLAGVTIYLHRSQAHRSLDLHPVVSHFFRFGHMSEGNRFREFVKRIIRINSAATETGSQHRCIHFIGTDGIDSNTVRGMITPQIFGQCCNSCLTGAIGQMSRTRVNAPG